MADKWDERTCQLDLSDSFSAAEKADLERRADQAGLTLEEYLRTRLGFPP